LPPSFSVQQQKSQNLGGKPPPTGFVTIYEIFGLATVICPASPGIHLEKTGAQGLSSTAAAEKGASVPAVMARYITCKSRLAVGVRK